MDSQTDSWDWEWLWFSGIHIFGFTEAQFWKLTPKQLFTFAQQYSKYNEAKHGKADDQSQQAVYIDQIM